MFLWLDSVSHGWGVWYTTTFVFVHISACVSIRWRSKHTFRRWCIEWRIKDITFSLGFSVWLLVLSNIEHLNNSCGRRLCKEDTRVSFCVRQTIYRIKRHRAAPDTLRHQTKRWYRYKLYNTEGQIRVNCKFSLKMTEENEQKTSKDVENDNTPSSAADENKGFVNGIASATKTKIHFTSIINIEISIRSTHC